MGTRGAGRAPGLGASFAGVLGWPLEATLSPVIHNAAFRRVGIDWTYLAFPVPPGSLGAAVAGLRALGAAGANVTMPHKEAAMGLVDEVVGDAIAVGAVNTIQRLGDSLIGHNTDVGGFTEFLTGDAGVDPAGNKALVLGAGGAARAVVRALANLGAAEVVVVARDVARAARVAEQAGEAGARATVVAAQPWGSAGGIAQAADLIVNATPVGSGGDEVLPFPSLGPDTVVIDLVYDPPSTPLLEAARGAGAIAWGGLGMLVRQAAASFEIWTGRDAPVEVMSAAAVRAIRSGRR